tara:strand:+ start:239 stop:550 length:312 start_codon:yes stop_codon:yes gene_type:complete
MKHLKINNNKGYYQTESDEWKEIDKIDKEDLMTLLDKATENDFEMDEYDAEKLPNKAHSIIYRNLYEKFSELVENKDRFKDESEQLYRNAFEKYSVKTSDEEE